MSPQCDPFSNANQVFFPDRTVRKSSRAEPFGPREDGGRALAQDQRSDRRINRLARMGRQSSSGVEQTDIGYSDLVDKVPLTILESFK